MGKKYIVEENTLLHLLYNTNKMYALEGGGVDNWCCYGESVCDFLDEVDAEDFYEVAQNEIQNFEVVQELDKKGDA